MGSKTYTKMKKIITMALFVVATLTSCELDKEDIAITPDPSDPTEPSAPVENFDDIYAMGWRQLDGQTARATINFDVTEADVTRSSGSTMERNIEDVNLYFYNETMGIEQHLFMGDTTSVTLPITPGGWSIYAIANIGSDMGSKSHDEVKAQQYEIVNESDIKYNDALIMSYFGEANIGGLLNLDILFTRAVSRIDIRVDLLSTALSKVTLSRLRLVNMPKKMALFGDGTAPASSDLMTYDYRDCGNGSTFSIYMLENLSGENTAITTEEQKTAANAPSTAAYIEIEGTTSDSWVTYRIYLGENNTSDFNVRRNNAYDMEVSIYSADASDFRTTVKPFPISVTASISSGSSSVVYYKPASGWTATYLISTMSIGIRLDKASNYAIAVNFELHADKGDTWGGMGAVYGTNSKDLTITFPAGSTTGTLSFTHRQESFFMWAPTHAIVSSITKLNAADENSYYPSTTLYQCSYSERWENY